MRHPGLLLHLLALGVLPSLPKPRSQEDLDHEDAEREAAALKVRSAAYQAALTAGLSRPEATAAANEAEREHRRCDENRAERLRAALQALEQGTGPRVVFDSITPAYAERMSAQGAMSGKSSFVEAYAREVATREAHRAQVAPVLVAAQAAEGPRTLQGPRWSMNYIERKGTRWNIQFGRLGEEHCAWLTNAATDVRMPRDAFERKHFDDKDPDFSGFDTRVELEAAIKKWAQTPERDRQAQREARKVRKAARSRRGW